MWGRQREEMETESDEIPWFAFPRQRKGKQAAVEEEEEEDENEGITRNWSSLEMLRWEGTVQV